MRAKKQRLAVVAVGAAVAMGVGLAASAQASATGGVYVPSPSDVVNCVVGTLNTLLYMSPPPVDSCSALPGGV
jgi:hypothetical protein